MILFSFFINSIGDDSCPDSTSCLPALGDNANVTNAIDIMFFCCHTVDVFTCSDGTMPIIDEITRRPMKCHPSNPLSCPSERVCSALIDGSHSCCPHPLLANVCAEAVVGHDGSVSRCKVLFPIVSHLNHPFSHSRTTGVRKENVVEQLTGTTSAVEFLPLHSGCFIQESLLCLK